MQLGFRLIRDKVLNAGESEFRYFIILKLEDFLLFDDLFQFSVEPINIAPELVYVSKRPCLVAFGWHSGGIGRQTFSRYGETGGHGGDVRDQFITPVSFEAGVFIRE